MFFQIYKALRNFLHKCVSLRFRSSKFINLKKRALFNWSSGKDSTLALYKILQQNEYEIVSFLTSISEEYQRVSMHGIRMDLLQEQVKNLGFPLTLMSVPNMPTMETYEKKMEQTLRSFHQKGIEYSIFGDIFLEDLRQYREEKLKNVDFKAIFPLWKQNTTELIQEFLTLGFKTIVTCVNEQYLDKSFVGRIIDEQFIADLPENVDPCGENGEFHTFTFDGPLFSKPVPFEKGEIVRKTYPKPQTENTDDDSDYGFWYCDLIPN